MEALQLFYESDIGSEITKIIEEKKDKSGKWSITFNALLQDTSKATGNRRYYPTELIQSALPQITQFIKQRHLYGEYDHPLADIMKATSDEMALKRHISILLEKVSHLFLNVWMDGPYVMGTVKTLHTHYGQELTNLIALDKASVGFSLRASGHSEQAPDGRLIIKREGFILVTWDAVIKPASEQAMFNPSTQRFALSESDTRCIHGVCDIIQKEPEMFTESNTHVRKQLITSKIDEVLDNLKF